MLTAFELTFFVGVLSKRVGVDKCREKMNKREIFFKSFSKC